MGQAFDRVRVQRVRLKYGLPAACPEMPNPRENGPRGDGRYSTQAAARLLNISIGTINNWCRSGKLESAQAVPHDPRWISLAPGTIAQLRKKNRKKRSSGH